MGEINDSVDLEMKSLLRESFNEIRFIDESHEYFLGDKKYLGVSELIALSAPLFNKEKVAQKMAARDGVTMEEILVKWGIRRDFSTVCGTEFHYYVSKYLEEGKKFPFITPIEKEIEQFHQFWDEKNASRYEVAANEQVIYDEELELAGTVDCIVRNKNDGKFYLLDWKTNKTIRHYNIYEKMLPPLEHLDNCEYTKYSLQTSIYKAMLHRHFGDFIEGCYLVHCSEEEPTYKVIVCEDLSKEVEAMFEMRKEALKTFRQDPS